MAAAELPSASRADSGPDALSAPARRLLFRRIGAPDAPSAVVRRLRSAISLGLLSDGDKLPREADLARELGVSTFSLREALSVLRGDGLIVTRPGKNGGSFVRVPPEPLPLANDELGRLSSAELRDLGDWRQMLIATAAGLAAARATQSNIERLACYGDQVATAADNDEARRAYARYHVELAAAAQSARLSRAEFGMHEEFDWLAGLILSDTARRRDSAAALHALTSAVRTRDPQAARDAAEQHATAIRTELARLRLELIAAQHRSPPLAEDGRGQQPFQAEIRRFAGHIVRQLGLLADDAAEPLAAGAGPAAIQHRVARCLFARLDELEPVTHGLGVIAEVDAVPGHPYWLDWWQRTPAGGLERDPRHVTDPRRDDFYDYESREFIAHPRKTHLPWATGPYVDHGGVDDYLVTMSVPIIRAGRFLGVAAADLLVASLERAFAPWLASASGPSLLLNAEHRVIVSNTVNHSASDVVPAAGDFQLHDLGIVGWSLATRPAAVRRAQVRRRRSGAADSPTTRRSPGSSGLPSTGC
jgi:DNA-binding FadR family transcriptional regulator